MAQGWSALEVLGEPGDHPDPLAWEGACAERAFAAAGTARVLVIGKSLASLLAGAVSDRDLSAVWLTPLLTEPSVIDGLARARCPTLLAGGTADASWQAEAIPTNPALDVLELPGVDHAVQVPGDPLASLDALRQIAESIGRLAAGLTVQEQLG
jgi:pimeloyl-ACP methyl ester carboxylesterase